MKAYQALLLLAFGGASLAVGIELQPKPEPPPLEAGQPAFPGLVHVLPLATRIEITGNGSTTTLVHPGDAAAAGWGVEERDGYPADAQKLRSLFSGLDDLRLVEPRTADPSLFARLGVDDPQAKGATGIRLRVFDADNRVLASLILGHRGVRPRPGMPDQLYLRRASDASAWLAEGKLDVSPDPLVWLRHEVLDIKAEQISSVEIHRDGATLTLHRSGNALVLDNPPPGKIDDIRLIEVSQALEGLTFADVRQGDLPGTPAGSVQFTTTGDQRVTILLSRDGKALWARFALSTSDAKTTLRLANHVFELPEWRLGTLVPKAADFLKADRPK